MAESEDVSCAGEGLNDDAGRGLLRVVRRLSSECGHKKSRISYEMRDDV
jgi:hypothetical protein